MLDLFLHREETYAAFSTLTNKIIYGYPHSIPLVTVLLYYWMIAYLPKLLTNPQQEPKKPSKILKVIMASWNLFLSVLSLVMLLGVATSYYNVIKKRGILESLCDTHHDSDALTPHLFWGHIVLYSKFFELFDTLFLIVKNPARKVPFLHWYHHMTVLLFSWYAAVYKYTPSYWFGSINCSVHTIMYFYYFLTELGYRPSWAMAITTIQILQMFVGIGLNVVWALLFFSGNNCLCTNPLLMLSAAVVMYGSYLLLQKEPQFLSTKIAARNNECVAEGVG
jgi:hypothetical protein